MELHVLFLVCAATAVRGIIVSHHTPLSYAPLVDHGLLLNAGVPQGSALPQYSRGGSLGQYASNYPTVHHPAEFTFASPPVRHAEPIKYPLPPAPVREEVDEPVPTAAPVLESRFFAYSYNAPAAYPPAAARPGGSLLGIAYSPASVVSRMSFTNGYGVSYGY